MNGTTTERPRRARQCCAWLLLMMGAAVAAGCAAPGPPAGDGPLRVVATTGMIGDAAARIGGPAVDVVSLMGPGVDPHLYKARAGDVRRLASADLVLYHGLHLEAAMAEVLSRMGERRPAVSVTEWIDRSELMSPAEYRGSHDPHVWFDVRLWTGAVRRIGAALREQDPANAADYERREAEYLVELDSLDAWVRWRISELPASRRVLITAHDAFGYFGRAYGFEVMGLQGISTTAEAGTADVQRLGEEIARRRIPAVFVESSIPRRTIEAVQAAAGARGFRVDIGGELYSDALGDAGTAEGTYIGMVRHNVETIVTSLSRRDVVAAPGAARRVR